jgi:hypothetical protein
VREEIDFTFLTGECRIGQALLREEQEGLEAIGSRGVLAGRDIGGAPRMQPKNDAATLAEKVGNRSYGWRLKLIAALPIEALGDKTRELHQRDREATLMR